MRIRTLTPSCVLILVACALASAFDGPKPEEIAWLKEHAIPLKTVEPGHGFDDLQPLKKLIGDARIVALGECTHGTREIFQMKHRLVEFLAAEMGFTVFSIEANMPESYAVNDYVVRGEGKPRRLLAGMYFWTWNTQEVLDMIEWMRTFNAAGKGRIAFTGFDMQTPDVAMGIVTEFLKHADAAYAGQAGESYALARKGTDAEPAEPYCTLVGTFPVENCSGKKIRFTGQIKTEGVTRPQAGLWWRVDGPDGVLAFDNMHDRAPTGTTDWKQFAIELDVAKEAVNINFGLLSTGDGVVWFDDLRVEIDGKPVDLAGKFDLDFEQLQSAAPQGFSLHSNQYLVGPDVSAFKAGKQSLRVECRAKPAPPKPPQPRLADISSSCKAVFEHMEGSRAPYAAQTSERDADWAIQNARVVAQCAQMNANEVSRDESMARNVEWILEHEPKGTRIVLWAHNGHVHDCTGAMGSWLRRTYGKDYVVLGFACGEGQYTAMGKDGLGVHPLQPPPAESVDAFFRAAQIPTGVIDLRTASKDDASSAWLTQTRPFRMIGALATDFQFGPCNVHECHDALLYIDKTTATQTFRW